MKLDFSQARIAIIGDAMLDIWHYGRWSKITAEGIPAFLVERTVEAPGGSANVARNIEAMGARANLFSKFAQECPVKIRYVAAEAFFRSDREDTSPIDKPAENAIMGNLEAITQPHVLVISDYAKGVCTPSLCQRLIVWAKERGIKTIVDPKGDDWSKYYDCDVICPNDAEYSKVVNERWNIGASSVLLTRGANGVALLPWDCTINAGDPKNWKTIPAHKATPKSVTGCGDSVVAALACCLAIGMPLEEAARVANAAGAVAVSHEGTHAVTREQLEAMLGT